jgi:glycosyltransferase involved in cell wall biosynthesis
MSVKYYDDSPNFAEVLGDKWQYKLLDMIDDYDLLHCGYTTSLDCVEAYVGLREKANIPVITDIDDDFVNVPTYNRAFQSYHQAAPHRRIVTLNLRVSDGVTVSTDHLATVLSPFARKLAVLPNYHDFEPWSQSPLDPRRLEDKSVRFMFSGGPGRLGDLATVKDAFEWAMDKFPQLRLFFVGVLPDWAYKWMENKIDPAANRCFFINSCPISTYRAILNWISPDVLFSPVVENEFNKSKSCIKAYDAAEISAAFLCSDWPTYEDVPNDCAIKVSGTYQWKEAIEQLIKDASMRVTLNSRLRDWTIEERLIDKHIHKWVSFYKEVIDKGPVRSYEDLNIWEHSAPPSQSPGGN